MNSLLRKIHETGKFINAKGETTLIRAHINLAQCEMLQEIISKNNFSKSIEIGLAYGISTLAIIEKIVENGGSHIAIDKYQEEDWSNKGLEIIAEAGYSDNLKFYDNFCYEVLPQLLDQRATFDFAFIDTTKLFDYIMVDFFYLDKLLKVGGIIAFDDLCYKSIRKCLRFISQLPNYEVYSCYPKLAGEFRLEKLFSKLRNFKWIKKIIKSELLLSDTKLGINTHCVAIRKIAEDKRKWDWHVDF